jgi:hypothetical protein
VAERFAVLLEFEHIVVDVVAAIKRNITFNRFEMPDLGRNSNGKVASREEGARSVVVSGRIGGSSQRKCGREREERDLVSCGWVDGTLEKPKGHVVGGSGKSRSSR